jgi:hypothetical protein
VETLRSFRASNGYERWDHWLVWPLVGLGLLFIVVLILPLTHPPTPAVARALSLISMAISVVFAIDYFIRVYLSLDAHTVCENSHP